MSIESAKTFMERMKTDEELAKKVIDIKSKEQALEFIQSQGFNFTYEEMGEAIGDIDDNALENIAGGKAGSVCGTLSLVACAVVHRIAGM